MLTHDELTDLATAASLVAKIMESVERRGVKPRDEQGRLYRNMTVAERNWSRMRTAKAALLSAYREETNSR